MLNDYEQLQLFEEDNYKIGSKEWCKYQYNKLVNKYTFEEIDELFSRSMKNAYDESGKVVKSFYDYCLIGICIDIMHYDFYDNFVNKYKKCRETVWKEKPKYLE